MSGVLAQEEMDTERVGNLPRVTQPLFLKSFVANSTLPKRYNWICSGPGSGIASGKMKNRENKRELSSFLPHKLAILNFFYKYISLL